MNKNLNQQVWDLLTFTPRPCQPHRNGWVCPPTQVQRSIDLIVWGLATAQRTRMSLEWREAL